MLCYSTQHLQRETTTKWGYKSWERTGGLWLGKLARNRRNVGRDIGINTYIIAQTIDHLPVHALTLQEKLQLRSEMRERIGCDAGGVINPRQINEEHRLASDQVSTRTPPRLRRTYIFHHSRLAPVVGN